LLRICPERATLSFTSVDDSFWVSDVPPEVIRGLCRLTDTSPTRHAYDAVLDALGWAVIDLPDCTYSGDYYCRVTASLRLWVAANRQGRIFAAILRFCSGFDDSPICFASMEAYLDARKTFDGVYQTTTRKTIGLVGPPERQGDYQYIEGPPLHFAIWRGVQGLLILQQCDFDYAYGTETLFWVHPCEEADPIPDEPPLEWLEPYGCQRFSVPQDSTG
jgi:hypothetical protein